MSEEARARVHEEVATRNSQEAIRKADATRDELTARIEHLERVVNQLSQTVQHLDQKYNLMLSERFDGRSTVG